ncbi:hypothetical protein GBA52_011629 [Prunus armeniaca]|nr:hypothetical protein GBA52_011629 [Prunus armeniaca]
MAVEAEKSGSLMGSCGVYSKIHLGSREMPLPLLLLRRLRPCLLCTMFTSWVRLTSLWSVRSFILPVRGNWQRLRLPSKPERSLQKTQAPWIVGEGLVIDEWKERRGKRKL